MKISVLHKAIKTKRPVEEIVELIQDGEFNIIDDRDKIDILLNIFNFEIYHSCFLKIFETIFDTGVHPHQMILKGTSRFTDSIMVFVSHGAILSTTRCQLCKLFILAGADPNLSPIGQYDGDYLCRYRNEYDGRDNLDKLFIDYGITSHFKSVMRFVLLTNESQHEILNCNSFQYFLRSYDMNIPDVLYNFSTGWLQIKLTPNALKMLIEADY